VLFFEVKTSIKTGGKNEMPGKKRIGALLKRVLLPMELEFGPFRGLAFQWEKFLELADQPFGVIFDLLSGGARKRKNGSKLMEMDGNWMKMDGNELKMTGKKKKKELACGG
jgi:hypothetical protein